MFLGKISALTGRKIFNDFSWLSLGTVLSALFSLVFMKIIAVYIEPDVYGKYSLHLQILLFIDTVLFLPFLQAFLKFYKSETDTKNVYRFYNSIFFLLFAISFPPVAIFMKIYFNLPFIYYILFAVFLFFTLFSSYLKNILYIRRKQKNVAVSVIVIKLVPLFMLLIILIIIVQRKEISIWLAQATGTSAAFLYLFFILKKEKSDYSFLSFSVNNDFRQLLKKNIQYTAPLILFGISSWIINVSDRYIINYFLDETQVGLYSAGYGLGSQMVAIAGGTILATVKPVMFDLYHKDKTKYFYTKKKLYLIYIAGGILLLAFIYLFSEIIGFALLSAKYENSFNIVYLISVAYFIVNLIYLTEITFYVSGKTVYLFYAVAAGALSNVLLNIILIPILGTTGAAFATILSFIIQFIILSIFYLKIKRGLIK